MKPFIAAAHNSRTIHDSAPGLLRTLAALSTTERAVIRSQSRTYPRDRSRLTTVSPSLYHHSRRCLRLTIAAPSAVPLLTFTAPATTPLARGPQSQSPLRPHSLLIVATPSTTPLSTRCPQMLMARCSLSQHLSRRPAVHVAAPPRLRTQLNAHDVSIISDSARSSLLLLAATSVTPLTTLTVAPSPTSLAICCAPSHCSPWLRSWLDAPDCSPCTPPFAAPNYSTHLRSHSQLAARTRESSATPLVIKCAPLRHHPRLRSRFVALTRIAISTATSLAAHHSWSQHHPRLRSWLTAHNRNTFCVGPLHDRITTATSLAAHCSRSPTSSATPLAARSSISQQHPRLRSQLPPLHRTLFRSRFAV